MAATAARSPATVTLSPRARARFFPPRRAPESSSLARTHARAYIRTCKTAESCSSMRAAEIVSGDAGILRAPHCTALAARARPPGKGRYLASRDREESGGRVARAVTTDDRSRWWGRLARERRAAARASASERASWRGSDNGGERPSPRRRARLVRAMGCAPCRGDASRIFLLRARGSLTRGLVRWRRDLGCGEVRMNVLRDQKL